MLSIAYVLGMASFYSVSGVLIALLGAQFNVQLWMQAPIVSILFAVVFIFFALTMLDVFVLKMPQKLDNWLGKKQNAGGGYLTTYLTGGIASLALSPCVTAPMASLLVYIATTGDAVMGGLSLFVLSLGMSVPLLLLGAGMGRLLPKAGGWMLYIKYFFAASMLAMAVWLLARLLPTVFALYLWSIFLIWLAIQLYGLSASKTQAHVHIQFVAGVLVYLVWVLNQPNGLIRSGLESQSKQLEQQALFLRFDAANALKINLDNIPVDDFVIVDIYADWCASCKKIERDVFANYQNASSYHFYQLDLSEMDEAKQALLADWQLFAPPALLAIKNGVVVSRMQGEFTLNQFANWLKKLPNTKPT